MLQHLRAGSESGGVIGDVGGRPSVRLEQCDPYVFGSVGGVFDGVAVKGRRRPVRAQRLATCRRKRRPPANRGTVAGSDRVVGQRSDVSIVIERDERTAVQHSSPPWG